MLTLILNITACSPESFTSPNEAGIPAKTIGAIHILDRFTLAEVSEAHAEHVVKSLQGLRLKGRSALVKFDEGPEGSTGRLPRKPRR